MTQPSGVVRRKPFRSFGFLIRFKDQFMNLLCSVQTIEGGSRLPILGPHEGADRINDVVDSLVVVTAPLTAVIAVAPPRQTADVPRRFFEGVTAALGELPL